MRRIVLAVGVLCAVAVTGRTTAQNSSPGPAFGAPGQVVGSSTGGPINPIGQRAPQVAPQVGQPINANGQQRPFDPNRPYDMFKGSGINPNDLVAPLVGPDGKPIDPPDSLDLLSEKIRQFFVRTAPTPPRPNFVPGIGRRNKERREMLWRRD